MMGHSCGLALRTAPFGPRQRHGPWEVGVSNVGEGGGSMEPPKTGGAVQEKGPIDRTINQLL